MASVTVAVSTISTAVLWIASTVSPQSILPNCTSEIDLNAAAEG